MNRQYAFSLLRRSLLADAAISGSTGLLMLFGGGVLEGVLGIPAVLIRYAGVALLPFAALVLYLASHEPLSRSSVLTIVALNIGWVASSLLLLLSGWISPTGLGTAFVIFQALVVAGLAELQYTALRRGTVAG